MNNKEFLELAKKTVLEVTEIDISLKKYKYQKNRSQNIVNARLCFIGIIKNYQKDFHTIKDQELSEFIGISRSLTNIYANKIKEKSDKIQYTVFENIRLCCQIIDYTLKPKRKLIDILYDYRQYLITELRDVDKTLLTIQNE